MQHSVEENGRGIYPQVFQGHPEQKKKIQDWLNYIWNMDQNGHQFHGILKEDQILQLRIDFQFF
jgi:hypothetical protein